MTYRIEFDGGTSCNVPSRGYGDGYGSYRINQERPVRLQFYRSMSANAAEILTLVKGVQEAKQKGATDLLIIGDSQIALKWANVAAGKRPATKLGKTSVEFQKSISFLQTAMAGILSIETKWQPRLKSVATFGH